MATFRRYPELALLALLLLLTATFSREFSKGAAIGPIYVTEVVMVLSGAIAVLRHGIRESWRLLRRVPLPALALIWAVGAIAVLRGLSDYSLDLVENDVGLVDYTLLLPLLALVVVDRERHEALYATLVACGFAAIATFVVVFTADQISGRAETLFTLQGSAAGLYISLAVSWIAARLANGVTTPRWLTAFLPLGLVLMGLTGQRSVWVVALLSLAVVVLMAPRPARVRTGLALAALLPVSFAIAIGTQSVLSEVAPAERTAASPPQGVDPADVGGSETRGSENFSTTSDSGGPQLAEEIVGLTDFSTDEGQNVRWRLGYWEMLLRQVPEQPLMGVGFGDPAEFYWQGRKYDFRDGAPLGGLDVAGPHNSFINFLWRLGIPAFAALMVIVLIAVLRTRRAIRGPIVESDRIVLTSLTAMLAAGVAASSFNEGLTGPFLGLFFWVPLGMLLLWPSTHGPVGRSRS